MADGTEERERNVGEQQQKLRVPELALLTGLFVLTVAWVGLSYLAYRLLF